MSGKSSSSSKGEKKSPLLGARALLSRQLNSASPRILEQEGMVREEAEGAMRGVAGEERSEMNDEESKRVLKMLESNGDIDEVMKSETGLIPVQLPLSFLDLKAKENEAESIDLSGDIKVKSEPADIDMVDTEEIKKEEIIKKPVKRVTVKKETNQDRFLNLLSTQSEGEQKLLFLQFPDVLPIKPTVENEGDSLPADETSDEQANDDGKPKQQKRFSLKRASEGYIGKLQLLKSGKARLLLGEVSLDVTMGTPCGFLQDVVSVHTENNRSEMICLGHVKHRLICTPDFERLLTSSPESAY
ncbi:DNA-directed RNA polymerase III subunit RPC4 [Acropora cervicornis]|uniref:DNA-directed RNA polymerase III subunit RPC4 n=1 Tax=Acropora cervicornis TaxID=6130 RepID=A0AAD9Q023_ACRCE|nr:DNA-directed RNA polymerase III subunit RPC4 [Acropora cervicornis]